MGQKCRKYRKARKNGVIPTPKKKLSGMVTKNKNAFKEKCKTAAPKNDEKLV